jgi:hypothetical protein
MRKIFLASASIAAGLMGGQALAQSGYVGAAYSSVEVDSSGVSADGDAWGIEGSANFSNGPGIGFALDAAFSDSDESDSVVGGTGHLFYRGDSSLFGGFIGVTDSDSTSSWYAGGEAQAYMSAATLGAAITYVTNDDVDVDGWGLNGAARFYPIPNLGLGGNLGWFTLDAGGADADAVTYGLNAEYQLSAAPISFLAGYSRFDSGDVDLEADAWTVGVRYNWGGTLKERDQGGGSLAGLSGAGALRY